MPNTTPAGWWGGVWGSLHPDESGCLGSYLAFAVRGIGEATVFMMFSYIQQSGCFLNVFLLAKLSLFLVRENRLFIFFPISLGFQFARFPSTQFGIYAATRKFRELIDVLFFWVPWSPARLPSSLHLLESSYACFLYKKSRVFSYIWGKGRGNTSTSSSRSWSSLLSLFLKNVKIFV